MYPFELTKRIKPNREQAKRSFYEIERVNFMVKFLNGAQNVKSQFAFVNKQLGHMDLAGPIL